MSLPKNGWAKGEDEPHILNSVSKTFTATAVGLAASEGRLKLTDKVISFFPDKLPATVSENLAAMTVRDLLTMNCGHDTDPTGTVRKKADADWVQEFLAFPVEHKPGTFYTYNSLGTYMLSAIVQKVTGEKVVDYLYPRLFRPLGIVNARWQESPQGINTGGWGLYLKTEDLAKMGQLFLQKGKWNGRQVLSEEWIAETSARANGANGQYILVIPEKDAVIVVTAHIGDMQVELDLIWKYLLPAL